MSYVEFTITFMLSASVPCCIIIDHLHRPSWEANTPLGDTSVTRNEVPVCQHFGAGAALHGTAAWHCYVALQHGTAI